MHFAIYSKCNIRSYNCKKRIFGSCFYLKMPEIVCRPSVECTLFHDSAKWKYILNNILYFIRSVSYRCKKYLFKFDWFWVCTQCYLTFNLNSNWNASITTNKRAKTEKFRHNDRQCVPSSPLTSGFLLFLQEYFVKKKRRGKQCFEKYEMILIQQNAYFSKHYTQLSK